MSTHSALTGADLHEPKGADSASAGQVYVATGAGSGTWSARQYTLTAVIADVSTAETVYVAVPYSGNVVRVTSVLEGAISIADATITVSDNASNSMGTLTITQSGSAAGDVDTLTPASNQDVTDNDYITIATDGASSSANKLWLTIVIERDD
jgi:hypothetical protein